MSASMAWDLSRIDTLPFPEQAIPEQAVPEALPEKGEPAQALPAQGAPGGAAVHPGTVIPDEFRVPGPLEGIGRNLAITGLGG